MGTHTSRARGMRIVVICLFTCLSACGAMQQGPDEEDDFFSDSHDPFDDPFFTGSPDWDQTILAQSEVLSQTDLKGEAAEEFEESESTGEKTQGILFSTILVAATLGKLALIPLGLGF